MKLSVIVSTYNQPAWLEKALAGYSCQTAGDFELLVADDGSTDDTRQLVERYAATARFPVRHLWQEDAGFRKNAILNKAILAATGDYLVFTDGDCIPRADFLAVHRALAIPGRFLSGGYCRLPMTTSEAISPDDIVSGRAFELRWLARHGFGPGRGWLKIVARPLGLDSMFNALTPVDRTFNGNNSSCYRADALAVGGFDKRMAYGGEDREFGYRLANSGVRPLLIRYSALCLHLEHARGYRNAAARAANEAIIRDTRTGRRTRTDHGLPPPKAMST